MTYEEIKKMIEDKGFGCVKVAQSGPTLYAEIYSKNGYKILETTNGENHSTDEEHPIAIAVSRLNDYVETDEPIEPFEEIINEEINKE